MADDAAELTSPKAEAPHGNILRNTLTDFTKRRNWSQYILQSLPDFLHVLDPDTKIRYASPSCKIITGYEPAEILGYPVINFIHPDDNDIFTKELDNLRAYSKSTRVFYRFRHINQTWVIIESRVQWYLGNQPNQVCLPQRSIGDQGFLIMARPYQNKTTALLDSFLELKIENERLVKRVAELKQEELEDEAERVSLAKDSEVSGVGQDHTSAASRNFRTRIGDAGIPLPASYPSNSVASTRKVKKLKVLRMPQSRICTVCGVSEAPEWRLGPIGPKTLCNACGLRWAKSNRRAISRDIEVNKASK